MKKLIALLLALTLVLSLAACSSDDEGETSDGGTTSTSDDKDTDTPADPLPEADEVDWEGETLVVWSFTNEVTDATVAFGEKYGVEVELNIIPTEDYPDTIRPVLESGVGAPDVYTAEAAFVEDFVNSGHYADLGALGAEGYADDYIDYVYSIGVDYDGVLRALSWQMTPGAVYYRRSIATEVFGTDDPAEISAKMNSFEGLFDMAEQLKAAGYKLFPDESAFRHFTNPNQVPWVDDNNKLLLPDERVEYFEYAKSLRDNEYTALAGEWSPAWFGGMQGTVTVGESSDETSVFGYCLPTWGLHYVLKTAMPEGADANPTAGDWAAATGPNSYSWGGTWLGVYEGSEKKDIAWAFVNYMTHDEEFLKPWLLETGDVTGVKSILESSDYIEGRTEDFLGGQNHIEFFVEGAKGISGEKFTRYDQNIDKFFGDAVANYVNGTLTLEEAIQGFKDQVKAAYPEITID
jgi:maltose-binding protein MalE